LTVDIDPFLVEALTNSEVNISGNCALAYTWEAAMRMLYCDGQEIEFSFSGNDMIYARINMDNLKRGSPKEMFKRKLFKTVKDSTTRERIQVLNILY